MRFISLRAIRPIHAFLTRICSRVSFSVAELLIALATIAALVYIIFRFSRIIKSKSRLKEVYITFAGLLAALLTVYAGFSVLWGVYYYGDDFVSVSGLSDEPVAAEDLQAVTAYFAALANEYAPQVNRDGNGVYCADKEALLEQSHEVYDNVLQTYPCLSGPAVNAKGIKCSVILSLMDFTGFFFPFTAEANVNTDFPSAHFAATIAHELAHQRGVAKEQEANFVAVLSSLEYGHPDYCYSACLLAYVHLSNALYKADLDAFKEVYNTLDDFILLDLAANNAYWRCFEGPVSEVSNTVYEGLLYSYGQELGLRSYGACVDLLVNYYLSEAKGCLAGTN